MKDQDYMMTTLNGEEYERVTQHAGVKTTICKNRFEVLCRDRGEINEQVIIQEFKAWLARRKQDALREDGGMSGEVP